MVYTMNIVGSVAFIAGVALLLWELFTRGLSKKSLFSYLCFLASILLLAPDVLYAVLACVGLTVLFLLLLLAARRERRGKNGGHS